MTRSAALQALRALLAEAGVESFAADARLLLCAAGEFSQVELLRQPQAALSETALARLAPMAARRAAREPFSRIVGRREFWGLPLAISPAVLDPRPETETLVEAVVGALGHRRQAPLRVLDLGSGSGAILCALLREFPAASGLGVDLSAQAAAQARANLAACGLAGRAHVVVGWWGKGVNAAFDVVVSNPPYVASSDIAALEREVRQHDPALALDGGADGLEAYRAIGADLNRLLTPEGQFFLEAGAGQADAVMAILRAHRLEAHALRMDLAGVARVVGGRAAAADESARPQQCHLAGGEKKTSL